MTREERVQRAIEYLVGYNNTGRLDNANLKGAVSRVRASLELTAVETAEAVTYFNVVRFG